MSCPYRTGSFRVAALASALCAASVAAHADNETPPQQTIDAIWRVQRFSFIYHSGNVFYSCTALEEKIGAILRAVGAHARISVDVRCELSGFVRHAFATITLAVPAEASQENVRAATTYDARTQLLARLKRVKLPTENDIHRFPASWQTISLSRNRNVGLGPGDCDLLRGMRDQIFPKISVRVDNGPHCIPGATTRMRPRIEVSALMPARPERVNTPVAAAESSG